MLTTWTYVRRKFMCILRYFYKINTVEDIFNNEKHWQKFLNSDLRPQLRHKLSLTGNTSGTSDFLESSVPETGKIPSKA
jgi:hypothetical protein